jgi:PBSX family phage terminase large subunit
MTKKLTKRQAIAKLWELGNLSYKLMGIQKEMRSAIIDGKDKRVTFLVSRRSGKSFVMCLAATEICISKPGAIVKYVCPKQKMVKTIVRPIMREIFKDCPPTLKAEELVGEGVYRFPNGSEIQFAGADNGNIENIRGGFADLCILDEAGFIADLGYAYHSVLTPTIRTTGGKIVLASTPSRDPNHEFMVDFVTQARAEDKLIKYTLYDNPMFTEEIIQEIIDDYPSGEEDPQFRREYLCETTNESQIMVIPEFTDELAKDIVKNTEIPSHYDYYVSGDPAATDLTVILFAYFDFLKAQLVIYDELVQGGEGHTITTQDIADGIVRKERIYFTNKLTGESKKPYLRVMDNNNKILINDLHADHDLMFIGTDKRDKDVHINKVRMMLKQGKIIINPRCKNLLYHIKTAKWHRVKSGPNAGDVRGFQRVKASSDGVFKAHHCDAVDAMIYLARNVDYNKNPYPDGYFEMNGENIFRPNGRLSAENKKLKSLMNAMMNNSSKKN